MSSELTKKINILRPYNFWTASFLQTGTDAPVLIKFLNNTFSVTPELSISYIGIG